MKKILLLITGFLSLTLGIIGIIFPILPTTPFVLLSAACFAASSEKMYSKLRKIKYFDAYITNYRDKTGIAKKIKIKSLIFLWVVLIISAVFSRKLTVCIVLAIVGVGVTAHILLIKTKKESKMDNQKFFKCTQCGNLVGMVLNKGVPLVCCGEKMQELVPNTVEASREKHLPKVTREGNKVIVEIGSIMHPMTPEHYISFIYLETELGGQRKNPNGEPRAEFDVMNDKPLNAFAYCNLHGLWKTEIK